MIIEENELVTLSESNGSVYISEIHEKFNLKQFEKITSKFPRLKVTDFKALKKAVDSSSSEPVEIGQWVNSIDIEISADYMQALIFVNESEDYIQQNIEKIRTNIHQLLQENHIVYGLIPVELEKVKTGKAYIVAQGLAPQKGEDAQVTYLQQAEKKPEIKADGKADYFDMNFIVEIKEGSWLGEKIPPQEGTPGINIHGEVLPGLNGDDVSLKYDADSAYEVEENGITILRAKTKGIIGEVNGLLTIQKQLIIDGDVGLETGNLKFDGSIQIKGTVMPGYSVIAAGDISIESKEGVNGALLIKSTEGDVFIKGGVFGKSLTKIEANKNIFIKHANECTLEAKENVHLGSYALGSTIIGNDIYVDERKGKIIGGKTIAINSITTACSGNSLERKTELIVQGVDRKILTENAKQKAEQMIKLQKEMTLTQTQLDQLNQFKIPMTKQQIASYEQKKQKYNRVEGEMKELDTEIQRILTLLRRTADYFINITQQANAGTIIQIGNKSTMIVATTKGNFKLENGDLNV